MYTAQGRVPGFILGNPMPYSVLTEKTGILHYTFKACRVTDLILVQRCLK